MRLFLAVLLVALTYPGFAVVYGALHGAGASGVLAWSSQHLPLVWAGAAAAVLVALVLFEWPRSLSARAYAAQLRDRFRSLQRESERAVEAALPDQMPREFDRLGPDTRPAPERFDGREAVDTTRR